MQNPTTLTLEDLRALPAIDRAVTLECAGNGRLEMRPLPTGEPWGAYAVSTARWTGALLSDVALQTRLPDEVLVVDAGSEDDTVAVARKFVFVRLLDGEPPVARGRNLGGRSASGDTAPPSKRSAATTSAVPG